MSARRLIVTTGIAWVLSLALALVVVTGVHRALTGLESVAVRTKSATTKGTRGLMAAAQPAPAAIGRSLAPPRALGQR
ncbi:MAG TPA: hypothetical protein VHO06_16470 [Polyangia bacterium]|nr:hypothetical protein [Polyangia bacterium]